MSAGATIAAGFADPVFQSQGAFRALLGALAEPGTLHALPAIEAPAGLAPATAAALLALADYETPVWLAPKLRDGAAGRWLRFHAGSPLADQADTALFAVIDSAGGPALAAFAPGEDAFPDRSATVIVQCPALVGGAEVALSGPGIAAVRAIAPSGLRPGFWGEAAANAARYPLGIDLVFACGAQVIGLPRSTQIRETR